MTAARRCAWATLCIALTAQADPLIIDGQPVAWPADAWPLPIADADLSWRRAAAEWTAGDAGFRPVDAAPIEPDGVVALAAWDAARWAADVGDPALIGFTLVTHADGALLDADVVLNDARCRFSATPDPRSFHRPTTLAHELGHVLGLGHVAAVDALMHAAQEPGEVGVIDGASLGDLAEVSVCCEQVRRPVLQEASARRLRFAQVTDDDIARAHHAENAGATRTALAIAADGAIDLPAGTYAVEIWTAPGQGGVFAVPGADVDAGSADATADDGAADAMAPGEPGLSRSEGGCVQAAGQGAGPGAPQLWILPGIFFLLGVWRRR